MSNRPNMLGRFARGLKLTVEKKKNVIAHLDIDILNSIDDEVEVETEVEEASEFETTKQAFLKNSNKD